LLKANSPQLPLKDQLLLNSKIHNKFPITGELLPKKTKTSVLKSEEISSTTPKLLPQPKKELATRINKDWIPSAEAINKSDVQIFEEVVAFTKGANAKQFAEF
jgi:hypothetical protein